MSQIIVDSTGDDFMFARKNGKFGFKTTIVRDGIELARPSPKIPRKSRDSRFKVARSKARSATRNRREQYESEHDWDHSEDHFDQDQPPSIVDYLVYCEYVIDYNGCCDVSYAQYCNMIYMINSRIKSHDSIKKTYSLPQIRPETDDIAYWPRRKLINKFNKLSYAQVAR
jgi:hypothetical protein